MEYRILNEKFIPAKGHKPMLICIHIREYLFIQAIASARRKQTSQCFCYEQMLVRIRSVVQFVLFPKHWRHWNYDHMNFSQYQPSNVMYNNSTAIGRMVRESIALRKKQLLLLRITKHIRLLFAAFGSISVTSGSKRS